MFDHPEIIIIVCYLALLIFLGVISARLFRGTGKDFFVASHSIGGFMLLMSVFGTTMTAFALVGSTGEAYATGILPYGKLASYSGLIHSACFFFVGLRLWSLGRRHGFVTQIQYFRARYDNELLGYILFPILVLLIIPYLLIGLVGAGAVMGGITRGFYPNAFPETNGALPGELTAFVITLVVLGYVFFGGVRSAAWANTFQTLVFMVMGVIAFILISDALGGPAEATARVVEHSPQHLSRESFASQMEFFSYCFIPLSVAMFPHLFQHWLTAKSGNSFKLTVIAHPICIMVTWVPCILIGIWAVGAVDAELMPKPPNDNATLGMMVDKFTHPVVAGFLAAGILAAIMSSLDSQFVCLGTMFTNDIVVRIIGKDKLSDQKLIWIARGFIAFIALITFALAAYIFSLPPADRSRVFGLGVWCFAGFGSLFPVVVAALYWKRTTAAGTISAIIVTALTWFYFFQDARFGADGDYTEKLWLQIHPAAFIFTACLLTLVIVSLLTKPPKAETVAKFFGRPAPEKAPAPAAPEASAAQS